MFSYVITQHVHDSRLFKSLELPVYQLLEYTHIHKYVGWCIFIYMGDAFYNVLLEATVYNTI